MRVAQEKVQQFHEKMDYLVAERPALPEFAMRIQRYDFMREELEEYMRAYENDDLVQVADALADLAYVLLGTAVVYGIDLQPIFDEVHRSNMTKTPLDPVTKKGGKGLGYEPPRLADLLVIQTTGLAHE